MAHEMINLLFRHEGRWQDRRPLISASAFRNIKIRVDAYCPCQSPEMICMLRRVTPADA